MWQTHTGMLLSHKKEWNIAIGSNMDGPRQYYTQWSQRAMYHLYVESRKYKSIYKTKTDWGTENIEWKYKIKYKINWASSQEIVEDRGACCAAVHGEGGGGRKVTWPSDWTTNSANTHEQRLVSRIYKILLKLVSRKMKKKKLKQKYVQSYKNQENSN